MKVEKSLNGVYDQMGFKTIKKWYEEICHEQLNSPDLSHPWGNVGILFGLFEDWVNGKQPNLFMMEGNFKDAAMYCLLRYQKSSEQRMRGSDKDCAAHALNVIARHWAAHREQGGI